MKLFTPSLLILTLFVLGGAIFKSIAPVRCTTILPNDNIFVLTGDARRIPFAVKKLNQTTDAKLYIIGAGASVILNDTRVIVESTSKTTLQNAVAIKRIVDMNGLNRIVLVTTVDHFNRAKYLIRNELPNIEIAACPAQLNGMPASKRLQRWTIEYIKFMGTLVGIKEGN